MLVGNFHFVLPCISFHCRSSFFCVVQESTHQLFCASAADLAPYSGEPYFDSASCALPRQRFGFGICSTHFVSFSAISVDLQSLDGGDIASEPSLVLPWHSRPYRTCPLHEQYSSFSSWHSANTSGKKSNLNLILSRLRQAVFESSSARHLSKAEMSTIFQLSILYISEIFRMFVQRHFRHYRRQFLHSVANLAVQLTVDLVLHVSRRYPVHDITRSNSSGLKVYC